MSPETKRKRRELALMSHQIQAMVKMGLYDSVNEGLVANYKETSEIVKLNTFLQWKKEGYKIIKGSTAYLVWGKPKQYKIDKTAENEKEKTFSFFPLCYLFSNNQVKKQ